MGIFEKSLIIMIVKFIFRWLISNEKNTDAKKRIEKKKTDNKEVNHAS